MKKVLTLFGLLDLLLLLRSYGWIINPQIGWNEYFWIQLGYTLFVLSLIPSSYFLAKEKNWYLDQLLSISYSIHAGKFSLNFVLALNNPKLTGTISSLFSPHFALQLSNFFFQQADNITLFLMMMEMARIGVTIYIHKTRFGMPSIY